MITAIIDFLAKLFKWDMSSSDNDPIVPVVVAPTTPPEAPKQPVEPSMIDNWADAIAVGEGANPASNNEGNLKYSTLTASWGATKGHAASDGGFLCQFPTMAMGRTALINFLTLGCEGELIISHPLPCTLDAFTTRFAGNPPQGYKDNIAKYLGVPLTVDIATFLNS